MINKNKPIVKCCFSCKDYDFLDHLCMDGSIKDQFDSCEDYEEVNGFRENFLNPLVEYITKKVKESQGDNK